MQPVWLQPRTFTFWGGSPGAWLQGSGMTGAAQRPPGVSAELGNPAGTGQGRSQPRVFPPLLVKVVLPQPVPCTSVALKFLDLVLAPTAGRTGWTSTGGSVLLQAFRVPLTLPSPGQEEG